MAMYDELDKRQVQMQRWAALAVARLIMAGGGKESRPFVGGRIDVEVGPGFMGTLTPTVIWVEDS